MKTILVATGFSKAADNAAIYSIELAGVFNARLVFFNTYQMPLPVSETPAIITREELEAGAQNKLKSAVERLDTGHTANITTEYREGPAVNTILKAAVDTKADLIVAGMKKTGKGARRIFGSTVTGLVRKSDIPMLVVPEEAKYTSVTTIALANETDLAPDADHHILDTLREIAERFHSKVYLVHIAEDTLKEEFEVINNPFRLTKMLMTLDPVYECIEGKNIPVALDDFTARYHVDILAMLPHRHSLLERWFFKSTTREMVFESRLPLLILPDRYSQKKEPWHDKEWIIL
jgi:nucleotide-binding universal stress UspA family protein